MDCRGAGSGLVELLLSLALGGGDSGLGLPGCLGDDLLRLGRRALARGIGLCLRGRDCRLGLLLRGVQHALGLLLRLCPVPVGLGLGV